MYADLSYECGRIDYRYQVCIVQLICTGINKEINMDHVN